MKMNSSIRLKVTFINTIVLIMCTVLLTISTSNLGSKSIDSVSGMALNTVKPSTQSQVIDENNYKYYEENILGRGEQAAQISTEAAKIEKSKFVMTSFKYMLIVIGLGTIITYLTTGKSLESVRKLSNEIKDINEHNLSNKIKEEGAEDEIKDLTRSFNSMLSRIDNAFESQKQFSANVAHELRTPLAVIRMKIDVFRKRKEPTIDDYEKLLKVIENNNDRLSKVVEELLNICNKDNIEFKDNIKFSKIIKSVVCELDELAKSKNISINIEESINSTSFNCFYGNEQLLYRAIFNLVENCIKYNYESGYVKINLYENNDAINILIEDSGVGIKEEDYENIFKPFYRVDKSRSRKIGGSGLGLAIVKTVIDQHKGSIDVKSSNSGSKFTIKIPYN